MLGIHHDGLAVREFREVDPVITSVEAQDRAFVSESLFHHPRADAEFVHQVDGSLLEDARADRRLDRFAAACFEDDRFDALQVKDLR